MQDPFSVRLIAGRREKVEGSSGRCSRRFRTDGCCKRKRYRLEWDPSSNLALPISQRNQFAHWLSNVKDGNRCECRNPTCNEAHTGMTQYCQEVYLIIQFGTDGRKSLKFSGLVGARFAPAVWSRMSGDGGHMFSLRHCNDCQVLTLCV